MKRIFTVALTFVLLLSLAACSKDPSNTEPADSNLSALHKGWVWRGASNAIGALTDQGYYYIPRTDNRVLTYMDIASGQGVVLCSVPGCPHNHDACDIMCAIVKCSHPGIDCEAFLKATDDFLLFHGNYLYYFHEDGTLQRRNATGSEEITVGIPGKAFLEAGDAVQFNQRFAAGAYLYYSAQLTSKQEDGSESSGYYLGRIHLSSGKDEVIFQQEITDGWSFQNIQLCAAQDGGALFYYSEGIPVKHNDPDLVEKSRAMKVALKMWDAATGEVTTLMEKARQDFLEVYLVDNGKVYFGGMGDTANKIRPDVIACDLVTGVEAVVQEQAHMVSMGGGYCTIVKDEGRTVLNLKTGHSVATNLGTLYPLAVSSVGFVTQRVIKGADGSTSAAGIDYFYIPYAALADGLTEDDLMIIYSEKSGFSNG